MKSKNIESQKNATNTPNDQSSRTEAAADDVPCEKTDSAAQVACSAIVRRCDDSEKIVKRESFLLIDDCAFDFAGELPHGELRTCAGIAFNSVIHAVFGKLDAVYFYPLNIVPSLFESLLLLFCADKPIVVGDGFIWGVLHDA